MKCDFDYCIYNRDFICILDEIQIDSLGMCESCETVTVPKENLKEYKHLHFNKLDFI